MVLVVCPYKEAAVDSVRSINPCSVRENIHSVEFLAGPPILAKSTYNQDQPVSFYAYANHDSLRLDSSY